MSAEEFDPRFDVVDRNGQSMDRSVLEETGTAFVPENQVLDLTKNEKRRTTALMMAIQAYQHLIIKDHEYLKAAADLARRDEGPKIKPATMDAMVEAAIKFDFFIAGKYSEPADETTRGGAQTEAAAEDPAAE